MNANGSWCARWQAQILKKALRYASDTLDLTRMHADRLTLCVMCQLEAFAKVETNVEEVRACVRGCHSMRMVHVLPVNVALTASIPRAFAGL